MLNTKILAIRDSIACYFEKVVTGEYNTAVARLIRALLWPLSLLYIAGLKAYLWLYKSGKRRQTRLAVPVISVGNLTFGGTGKTPAVITLCKMLQKSGQRPVVLSRGHGGTSKHGTVVTNGNDILCSGRRCGDEPMLLARTLHGVPVITGKDRRQTGRQASELFDPTVLVLDDGMQYWQLARDLDIAIMNASKPFGSGFVMPAGDLREPVTGLSRAGVILVNGLSELDNDKQSALREQVNKLAPEASIFACRRYAIGFTDAQYGEKLDVDWIRGKKVLAFCGIGDPHSFEAMLTDLGADIAAFVVFRDHVDYQAADMETVAAEKEKSGAEIVVTTAKDISKMSPRTAAGRPLKKMPVMPENLFVLDIELEIEDSERFEEYVTNRINRTNTPIASEETPDQTAG